MSQKYAVVILVTLAFVFLGYVLVRMRRHRSKPDIVEIAYRLLRLRTNLRKYNKNNTGDILDLLADIETTLLDSLRYLGASENSLMQAIQVSELVQVLPGDLLTNMKKSAKLLYDLKLNPKALTDQELSLLSEVVDSVYNIFITSRVLSNRLKHDE